MGKKGKKGKGKKGKGRPSKGRPTLIPPPTVPELPPEPVFDRKLPVFSFDLMVTRLSVPGVALIDPRKLEVLVSFGGNNFTLTASKTDISEFQSNANVTFQKDCDELKQIIEESGGLSFEVRYEEESVGLGKVRLPKKLTNSINLDMTEFSYTRTCRLELDAKPTDGKPTGGKPTGGKPTGREAQGGRLEFLCKLFIKCGDYARDGENCRNLNKNISPEDIVFIIGKSQANTSCCDPCRDVLQIEAQKEKDYIIQANPGSR